VVLSPHPHSHSLTLTQGWVVVEWNSGETNDYRWGAEGKYDLSIVDFAAPASGPRWSLWIVSRKVFSSTPLHWCKGIHTLSRTVRYCMLAAPYSRSHSLSRPHTYVHSPPLTNTPPLPLPHRCHPQYTDNPSSAPCVRKHWHPSLCRCDHW
jgi:Mib-herc2 protein